MKPMKISNLINLDLYSFKLYKLFLIANLLFEWIFRIKKNMVNYKWKYTKQICITIKATRLW
jgi:hypothetical protein